MGGDFRADIDTTRALL